jgi:hypothetical protein
MSITCSQGHENPDGSAFCDECGERLVPANVTTADTTASEPPVAPAAPATPEVAATTPSTLSSSAPPATAAAPRLVVQADGAEFDLSGKNEVLVGREDPASNIYPDIDLTPHGGEEGGVSRMHAKIYLDGGQYMVEDLNSTNFTQLNRQKLSPKTPTPIKDGDELRLGRVVLTFKTAQP